MLDTSSGTKSRIAYVLSLHQYAPSGLKSLDKINEYTNNGIVFYYSDAQLL